MQAVIAVALVGYKKSGKTSLAAELCRHLSDSGYSVAAAKFSHHSLDMADTDTETLARSCVAVAGLGEEQSSLFWSYPRYLPDLLPLMHADILVVEGGKHLGYLPRIILPRSESETGDLDNGLAIGTWGDVRSPSLTQVNDIAQLAHLVLERGFLLPGLDCSACGREDCASLAREIVSGEASAEACEAVRKDLEVLVNGQPLPLNPFVRSIIAGAIQGMLGSLKGYAPGNLDIHMET
jgi:molybdopterin-guanine dinucleotide biosynthesis protein B